MPASRCEHFPPWDHLQELKIEGPVVTIKTEVAYSIKPGSRRKVSASEPSGNLHHSKSNITLQYFKRCSNADPMFLYCLIRTPACLGRPMLSTFANGQKDVKPSRPSYNR